MTELTVYNMEGAEVGRKEIDLAAFGKRPNMKLMAEALVMYEANARQGSASTKSRTEVAGNNQKLFRQKGTGRARMGTKKTNIWRGGGTQFGPKPRDFSYTMPRKKLHGALKSALLAKVLDNEVACVEKLAAPEKPGTKVFAAFVGKIAPRQSVLVVLPNSVSKDAEGKPAVDPQIREANNRLYLSMRNIRDMRVAELKDLNAYDVLRQKKILFPVEVLEEMLKGFGK